MRKRKSVRIIAVALLCTLMIGAAIGIGVAADDKSGENVAEIGMKNLEYGDELKLAVQVTQHEAGTLYLGIWKGGTTDFANTKPIYTTSTFYTDSTSEGDPVTYALTQGIAAKNIDEIYEFCVYVVAEDGTVYYGENMPYSVTTYLQERLDAIEGLTDDDSNERRTLYNAVIAYGAAAKDDLFGQK